MTGGALARAFDAALLRDDQPRCSELEEGKPGRYTNEAGDGCDGADASSKGDDLDAIRAGAAKGSGAVVVGSARGPSPEIEARTAAVMKSFGLTQGDIGAMFAPGGAEAQVYALAQHDEDELFVDVRGDGYSASRQIRRDADGNPEIYNQSLAVAEGRRRKGLAAAVLAREVDAAARLGFARIKTQAAGSRYEEMKGYYVWPLLGFDGEFFGQEFLSRDVIDDAHASGYARLSDAMKTARGRAWWADYGDSVSVEFDLSGGSLSRRMLAAYLRKRAKRDAKRARLDAWLAAAGWRADQPRCSEIEEGKPGRFTNEDGQGCDGAEGSKESASADALPEVRFRTNVTPREFIDARNATTRPGFLSPLTEADLAGKTLVLSTDGKVGYMLAPDGYAGNLFNNGGPKGAGKAAMIHAIEHGAGYLDCFDGFLPDLYHEYGFVETGRLKFVDEFAPTGWDYGRYGRPDVVFMAYRGGDRKTLKDRVGTFGEHRKPAELVDDYDAALDRARKVSRGADGAERRGVGREAQGAARRAGRLHRQPLARDDQPRCSDTDEDATGQYTNEAGDGCDGAKGAGEKKGVGDYAAKGRGTILSESKLDQEANDLLKRFGLGPSEILDLFGPDGSEVTYGVSQPSDDPEGRGGSIWVTTKIGRVAGLSVEHDGILYTLTMESTRIIEKPSRKDGVVVRNASLSVTPRGSGWGTQYLAREIAAAERLGIKRIVVDEAVGGPGAGYNGYYTWPALGFDAPIERLHTQPAYAELRKRWPDAKRLSDVMSTPEGRKFWKEKGGGLFEIEFDVTPGSPSRKVFDAYLERRFGAGGKRSLRRDQPRCSELEEGSTGQYTNADGQGCDGAKGAGEKSKVEEYSAKGKGKLTGDLFDSGSEGRAAAEALLKRMGLKADDVLDLFGPEGAEVKIGVDVATNADDGRGGAIWAHTKIEPDDPEAEGLRVDAWRRIEKNGVGELVLTNMDLTVYPRGSGWGTRFIAREVAAAEKLGIKRIVVDTAAGSSSSTSYNGYYTWPLLGFDAPLSSMKNRLFYHELTERFPEAKNLSDVLATREGREWWKEKGSTVSNVQFDVTPGSVSRRIFEAYLERRFGGADATRAWLRALAILLRADDQPRCSELEEGKPGRFTNEDGQGCDGAEGAKPRDLGDALEDAGLPRDLPLAPSASALREALERGAYEFKATRRGDDRIDVDITIPTPDDWPTVESPMSGRTWPYNPEVAEPTNNPDGPLLKPREGWSDYLTGIVQAEDGYIFRGMSWEEWQDAQRNGEIRSRGGYTLGEEQEGLTFYSTDPDQAATYANGFAPWQYHATPTRPAIVVKVKDPGTAKRTPGEGDDERGIPGAISLDDLVAVYQGDVYTTRPGSQELVLDRGKWRAGSGSSPSSSVYWRFLWGEDDKRRARLDAWLRSDQPRCSEIEEGHSGQYTNDDGEGCEGAAGKGDEQPMGGRKSTREPGDDSTDEYKDHGAGRQKLNFEDGSVMESYLADPEKMQPTEGEGKYTDRVQVDDAAARALKAERERLLAGDSEEQRAAAERLAAEEERLRELTRQFDEHQVRDMEVYNEVEDELRPAWKADEARAKEIAAKLNAGEEVSAEDRAWHEAFQKDSLYSRVRADERMTPFVEERSQWFNTLADQRDVIREARRALVEADRKSLFLDEGERLDVSVEIGKADGAAFTDAAAEARWLDRLGQAREFLSGVIHKDALTRAEDDKTRPAVVTLKSGSDTIPYTGYASLHGNQVVLSEGVPAATMVHELAHLVEYGLGSMSRYAPAAMEFLNQRLSDAERDAPFDKLIKYHPGSAGYGMGVLRDHLDQLGVVVSGDSPSAGWYAGSTRGMQMIDLAAGRLYPPKNFREIHEAQRRDYLSGTSIATEVVSMGFEAMFRNPRRFAKLDPDYFDFILGIARGYTKSKGRWGQPRKPSRKKRKPKK